jgi:hypothetical protein
MRQFMKRLMGLDTKLKGAKASRLSRGFRPTLETMEERMALSTVNLTDGGHTLVITGDARDNHVSIVQDDAHDKLTVSYDSFVYTRLGRAIPVTLSQTFQSSQIRTIEADLKGGNDTINWSLARGSNFSYSKTAWVDLGAGDDSASYNIAAPFLRGGLIRGNLNITTYGREGNDSVVGNFGHKDGGMLNFNALMGQGNDEAHANLWGDVTGGASVGLSLVGGDGNDTLSVWHTYNQDVGAYKAVNISRDSHVGMYLDGGQGDDLISVTEAGRVNGLLNITAHGGEGKDTLNADVVLTPNSTPGNVRAALMGDEGDDTLNFHLVNNYYGPSVAQAVVDGGSGDDTAYTTPNVTAVSIEDLWVYAV